MSKITIKQVADELGMHPQTVRVFIQSGRFPFGVAMKMPGSNQYTYTIFPQKFYEYIGEVGRK